jgi:gluconate kinase
MKLELSKESRDRVYQFTEIYSNKEVCVFTGAGVSFVKSKKFKTSGWWTFLEDIYEDIQSSIKKRRHMLDFEMLKKKYPHPWDIADFFQDMVGKEELERIICRLLNRKVTTDLIYKRLPVGYLKNATTLNAVISFCSSIRAKRRHQCLVPNPKVKAIITLNYDCFLEAGATTKYNAGPFKPMSSRSSKPRSSQLPVYHIHGYAPYGVVFKITQQALNRLRQEEIPNKLLRDLEELSSQPLLEKPEFLKTLKKKIGDDQTKKYSKSILKCSALDRKPKHLLVLTKESYRRAYSPHGFADRTIDHFLGQYSTLFVGVSFEDALLIKKLASLSAPDKPDHFALVHQENADAISKRLKPTRVLSVIYPQHDQILSILGYTYRSTLPSETMIPKETSSGDVYGYEKVFADEYWGLLLKNKR